MIGEASAIPQVSDCAYDFVLGSHVLEHVANPLQAVLEWKRITKPGGAIIAVIPHFSNTFDRRRAITTFEHLLSDYSNKTPDTDMTHLPEILKAHANPTSELRRQLVDNATNRMMHHHVFSPALVAQIFDWLRVRMVTLTVEKPWHIIAVGQKG